MGGRVLVLLCCVGLTAIGTVVGLVAIFRLACRLCGLPKPGVLAALGIILVSWFAELLVGAVVVAVLAAGYAAADLPKWEVDWAAFWLAPPVDMLVSAGLHAGMLRISFGKALEVWFVQRLILLAVVLGVVGIAAVAVMAVKA